MIFTSKIKSESKVLVNRNIIERAKKIAPFLQYDENPYLIVSDEGKLVWVLDAYTTSNLYPYSQSIEINDIWGTKDINYIRNSVKVLIDSYDGTMKFYITDKSDPIIRAYQKAYPTLFQDLDTQELPEYVWENVKYPEYLFNIQAQILENYHEKETGIFYRNDNEWSIILDKEDDVTNKMLPYYSVEKEQENTNQTLNIMFSQANRQNVIAYLSTINNSKEEYGKLKLYNVSKEQNIVGPLQIDNQIDETTDITGELKTWSSGGYKITRKINAVKLENSMLYVIPVEVIDLNESSQIINVKKIIVASGDKLAIGNTLNEALEKLVSQNAVKIEITSTDDLDSLLKEIIKANENVKSSTNSNDWEMLGKDIKALQELIDKLKVMQEEVE